MLKHRVFSKRCIHHLWYGRVTHPFFFHNLTIMHSLMIVLYLDTITSCTQLLNQWWKPWSVMVRLSSVDIPSLIDMIWQIACGISAKVKGIQELRDDNLPVSYNYSWLLLQVKYTWLSKFRLRCRWVLWFFILIGFIYRRIWCWITHNVAEIYIVSAWHSRCTVGVRME